MKIGYPGAQAIADVLQAATNLTEVGLYFDETEIGVQGAQALGKATGANASIVRAEVIFGITEGELSEACKATFEAASGGRAMRYLDIRAIN